MKSIARQKIVSRARCVPYACYMNYSGVIPACLTTVAHLAISVFSNAANSAAVPAIGQTGVYTSILLI